MVVVVVAVLVGIAVVADFKNVVVLLVEVDVVVVVDIVVVDEPLNMHYFVSSKTSTHKMENFHTDRTLWGKQKT